MASVLQEVLEVNKMSVDALRRKYKELSTPSRRSPPAAVK